MNKRMIIIVSLVIGSMPIISIFPGKLVAAAAEPNGWWDLDYSYRVPLTLDVSGDSPPANYQYRIVLDDNDNLGGNVAFENFQDLRFLENETSGSLDFWFENYISGDNVVVWVKREDNSLDDNIIYCYYGNASAGSAENGFDVFPELFDDFEDGDASDWIDEGSHSTTAQDTIIKAGSYSGQITGGTAPDEGYKTFTNTTSDFYFEYDLRIEEADAGTYHIYSLDATAGSYNDSVNLSTSDVLRYFDGAYHTLVDPHNPDQWYKFKIAVHPSSDTFDIWIDGVSFGAGLGTRGNITGGIEAMAFSLKIATDKIYFDQMFFRKYASPEPTATAGSEEAAHILPTQPTLYLPDNAATLDTYTPYFEWTNAENADNHRLLIDDDPAFATPTENRVFVADNFYTIAEENELSNDNYYWKVTATNENGDNESLTWTFNVDVRPSLISPLDDSTTTDNTPTFVWENTTENSWLLIDNHSNFSSPEENRLIVADNSYTIPPENFLPDGTYHWKVVDTDNNESGVWSFTILEVIPAVAYDDTEIREIVYIALAFGSFGVIALALQYSKKKVEK